jgi:hypothetical protein
VEVFNNVFPDFKITRYVLRKVYRSYHIKNKKLKKKKYIPIQSRSKIEVEAREAKYNLNLYKSLGYKIIYADEFCTNRNTLVTNSWSLKN